MQINNINFKAKHITSTNIRNTKTDDLRNADVIEFIQYNDNDLETVQTLSKKWHQDISTSLFHSFQHYNPTQKEHYYALSLQQDNYEKAKPENILGICLVTEYNKKNMVKLDFLQTNPKYISKKNDINDIKEYKKIGTSLINFLKQEFKSKTIRVIALEDAKDFYKKNGFRPLSDKYDNVMIYNA